jgi:hypothetical protein
MGQMPIVFYFTNRCAIPTAVGRVYNVQRTHVFNVASVKASLGKSSAARRARLHLPCAYRPSLHPPDEACVLWSEARCLLHGLPSRQAVA